MLEFAVWSLFLKNVAISFFDFGAELGSDPGRDGDQDGMEGESLSEPGCGAVLLAAGELFCACALLCDALNLFAVRGRWPLGVGKFCLADLL